jgi:hypothetical protein
MMAWGVHCVYISAAHGLAPWSGGPDPDPTPTPAVAKQAAPKLTPSIRFSIMSLKELSSHADAVSNTVQSHRQAIKALDKFDEDWDKAAAEFSAKQAEFLAKEELRDEKRLELVQKMHILSNIHSRVAAPRGETVKVAVPVGSEVLLMHDGPMPHPSAPDLEVIQCSVSPLGFDAAQSPLLIALADQDAMAILSLLLFFSPSLWD